MVNIFGKSNFRRTLKKSWKPLITGRMNEKVKSRPTTLNRRFLAPISKTKENDILSCAALMGLIFISFFSLMLVGYWNNVEISLRTCLKANVYVYVLFINLH